MKILITGSSGFVGGNLVLGLAAARAQAQLFAITGTRQPESRVQRVSESYPIDLLDHEQCIELIQKLQPDVLIHAAALSETAFCEREPEQTFAVNVEGTQSLLDASERLPSKPLFIFLSTDLVFEGAQPCEGGHSEQAAPAPVSVYAHSKVAAEQLFTPYSGPFSILRLSLVYGPEVNNSQGFLAWMRKRFESGQECDLFVDEFRSPLCTQDITATCHALIARYQNNETIPPLLHLSGSERVSRYQFGQKLCAVAGYNPELLSAISQGEYRDGPMRPKDVSLNSALAAQLLGRPTLSVTEGLKLCKLPRFS